ncbi:MAG: hypothetical protein K2M76_05850 [Muribaculaceae bacterium]|nr:hypothetical protein [Muribaculaceae bacterium]
MGTAPSPMMAWMVTFVVFVIFFLGAALISSMINFRPDRSDVTTRKMWYWILCVLTPVCSFVINYFTYITSILIPTAKSTYTTQASIAAGVSFVLFIGLGFVVAKSTHGKLSNWW